MAVGNGAECFGGRACLNGKESLDSTSVLVQIRLKNFQLQVAVHWSHDVTSASPSSNQLDGSHSTRVFRPTRVATASHKKKSSAKFQQIHRRRVDLARRSAFDLQ